MVKLQRGVRARLVARAHSIAGVALRLRFAGSGVLAFLVGCLLSPAYAQSVPRAQDNGHSGPVTAAELVETRGLSGLAVSPTGAYAVVRVDQQRLDRNDTDLEWRVVRLATGESWRLGDAGGPLWNVNGGLDMEMPQWSADEQWIYFRALEDQQVQVWRASRDGTRREQVTADASDVLAFLADRDGALHYMTAGASRAEIIAAEKKDYDSGILMDGAIIPGYPLVRSFPVNGRMATYRFLLPASMHFGRATLLGDRPPVVKTLTPDKRVVAASEQITKRLNDWWVASAGGESPFDPHDQESSTLPDGSQSAEVVYRSAVTSGTATTRSRKATLVWRKSGKETDCAAAQCIEATRIASIGWASRNELAFQTGSRSMTGLHVWDIARNKVRTIVSTDGVLGAYGSGVRGDCKLAGVQAICIASNADEPPRLVAIDLGSGRERVLLDPNTALTPDRLGVAEMISVSDSFGGRAQARLVLPRAWIKADPAQRPRLPLVISSYACSGFLLGGSGRDVPEHVFAGLGYASVCLDLTGPNVTRSEGFQASQGNANRSGVEFAEDVVRVLDQRGIVDPDRVTFAGFSGSSSAATYGLSRSRKFTTVIVTTQSSMDPISYYQNSQASRIRGMFEAWGYKAPYDRSPNAFFEENSAAWNADKIVTPLLMQLADAEYVAMLQLLTNMRDVGRAVEMYVYPDEYHLKRQPLHRLAVYERNIDWVNFWLRGVENLDPSRGLQNQRWEGMRTQQCKLFSGAGAFPDPPWYCRATFEANP